jgi:hypothetical protein
MNDLMAPRSRSVLLLLTAAACLAAGAPCHARASRIWSHEELAKDADVIVIVSATGTQDTADKLAGAGLQGQLVGVNTEFTVQAALKGKVDGKLTVLHFRYPDPTPPIINGPNLVAFRSGTGAPSYLLFLRKREDGRYEPLAGQMDPVNSCFTLSKATEAIPAHARPAERK